jgi:hypothetical protein
MSPHGSVIVQASGASTLAPAIILWVPFQNVSFGSKADIASRPRHVRYPLKVDIHQRGSTSSKCQKPPPRLKDR